MIYITLGVFFIIYCELLGRSLFAYFKKENPVFAFPIGFALIMAFSYVGTSILSAFNCSYTLIFIIDLLITILSLVFIVYEFKAISKKLKIGHYLVLIVCVVALSYYSFNTSFGDLSGFDTTHYLNLVTGNIQAERLNFNNRLYNYIGEFSSYQYQYTFQSYYYFASFLMGILSKVFSLLNVRFYASTAFIWMFQIMFHAIFSAIIIEALNRFLPKRNLLGILVISVFVFAYGRLYFNSVFGFYGNSLRTLIFGILSFYTIEYLNDHSRLNILLISIMCLAACSLSSTGVFTIYFYLFGLFFVSAKNDKYIVEWIALVIFVPTINLTTVIIGNIYFGLLFSVIFTVMLYLANNLLVKIMCIDKYRWSILALCFVLMFALSIYVEPNILNFDAFFNNLSEVYDMTLDYFNYSWGHESTLIFKFVSLLIFSIALLVAYKDKYIKIIWILVLVFFNPLCCKFLNHVDIVYYRAYDVIINPVLLIYFLKLIDLKMEEHNFKGKYVFETIFAVMLIGTLYFDPINKPIYYHKSFETNDDFNGIYKMDNDEIDVINKLRDDIYYRSLSRPLISTSNLLTQSMIPNAEYIFGRNYFANEKWNESQYQVYAMFWPVDHYGDERQPEDVDYANMCQYLEESQLDYLVLDKNMIYHDENDDIYYSMKYAVDRCNEYPIYENDTYAIYFYGVE